MKHPQKISKILFGVGNPGSKYSKNRHNIGKIFAAYLGKQNNQNFRPSSVAGDHIVFKNSKDQFVAVYQSPSYMNLSGVPFKIAMKQCQITNPEDILIMHDDLDTKIGKAKVKVGGSPEGHNGLKSVISQIGTQNFLRLKIGVSRPESHEPKVVAQYVLSDFLKEEFEILQNQSFPKAVEVLKQRDCFSILLILTFIILPYTYFYSEERSSDYDIDLDYTESDANEKIISAIKNTVYFILIFLIMLVIGLSLRPKQKTDLKHGQEVEWVKQLFDVDHVGEQAIHFCLAIIASFGTIFWIIYGSYGLGILPWMLIKGKKSLEQEKTELQNDLTDIKLKFKYIQQKYSKSHTKISKSDQKMLAQLRKKERIITAKNSRIVEIQDNTSELVQKLVKVFTPFRQMIGIGLLGLSILIFWSLLLTSADRFMNSECGFTCGYIVGQKNLFNPIDSFLVYSSNYFPLDYFFFFILVTYIFIILMYGIIKFGFNFLLKGYNISKGTTLPQALIILSFILNISILVLATQFITLSPQYTTFGAQKYKSTEKLCQLNAIGITSNYQCNMSTISRFVNKISLSFPLFAIVSFFANVCFMVLNGVYFLYGVLKRKSSQIDEDEDDLIFNDLDEEGQQLKTFR